MPTAAQIRVSKNKITFVGENKNIFIKHCSNVKNDSCPKSFFLVDKAGEGWVFVRQGMSDRTYDYKVYPQIIKVDGEEWTYLSNGSFNLIYLNEAKTEVCRIFMDMTKDQYTAKIDAADRLIRLAPLINPRFPSPRLSTDKTCLIMPYFKGVPGLPQTPREVHSKIIDTFKNEGRIITDGFAANAHGDLLANFKKEKKPNGQDNEYVIACFDYGFALDLRLDADGRPKSPVSTDAWAGFKEAYNTTFADHRNWQYEDERTPNADVQKIQEKFFVINTIQALLYIQKYWPTFHPDILKDNVYLVERFAKRYNSIDVFNHLKKNGFNDDTIDKFFDKIDSVGLRVFWCASLNVRFSREVLQILVQWVIIFPFRENETICMEYFTRRALRIKVFMETLEIQYQVPKAVVLQAVSTISDVQKIDEIIISDEYEKNTMRPLLCELATKIRSTISPAHTAPGSANAVLFQLPKKDEILQRLFTSQGASIKVFLIEKMSFENSDNDPTKTLYNTLLKHAVNSFSFDTEQETFASMTNDALQKHYKNLNEQLPLELFPEAFNTISVLQKKRNEELERIATTGIARPFASHLNCLISR